MISAQTFALSTSTVGRRTLAGIDFAFPKTTQKAVWKVKIMQFLKKYSSTTESFEMHDFPSYCHPTRASLPHSHAPLG